MKVLHIISGLARGGAEACLCRLVAHAHKVRHEVLVLSDIDDLDDQIRATGARVTYIDVRRGWAGVLRLWSVYRFIQDSRPDVVQTWMYHADVIGGVCAKLAGVQAVAWGLHHACPDSIDLSRSARLFAWLGKMMSGWVPGCILACSDTSMACHVRYGYKPGVMRIARNGYDTDVFKISRELGDQVRDEWGLSESPPLLGAVARYHPIKGHAVLLAALWRLKAKNVAFQCLLVGDGMDQHNTSLHQLLAQFDLTQHVVLMGPRSDIPGVMNALDILILSSLSEAFPNVLNEAMACGTPCVTTDVGDARQIVGDTGWVVPPGDAEALADAMVQALHMRGDEQAWVRQGMRARQRIVDNFSLGRMVDAYQTCWHELQARQDGALA